MKINMWMIANMLRNETITVDISDNESYDLYGISFTEMPGHVCLSTSMNGSNVICESNGDRITLSNCSFQYAFERIQQIFNCYNEWSDSVVQYCRARNWQKIVDSVEHMFSNPLVLFDLNMKVLAMSSRFPKGTVDEEWDYLLEYGASSYSAIIAGRSRPRFVEALHEGPGLYYTTSMAHNKDEYLTVCIKYNGEPWGYLSSVSTVKKFSPGEVHTLMSLAKIMGNYIIDKFEESCEAFNNAYKDYLTSQSANDIDSITRFLNTYGWIISECYCVVCACFLGKDKDEQLRRMYVASVNTFDIPCVIISDTIVYILNSNDPMFNDTKAQIHSLSKYFSVALVYSLCLDNIHNIYYCYDQVRFIMDRTTLKPGKTYHFYHHAIDYIICKSDSTALLHACKPEIVKLFGENEKSRSIAQSLELYLKNERSLKKTALEQNLHKNTIAYRIQKALEKTLLNLEDSYEREYAKITFIVLHIFGYPREDANGILSESNHCTQH